MVIALATARSTYQAHDAELLLIRPDGHIGLRTQSQDTAAVTAYLAAVTASTGPWSAGPGAD